MTINLRFFKNNGIIFLHETLFTKGFHEVFYMTDSKLTKNELKARLTDTLTRLYGVEPTTATADQLYRAFAIIIRDYLSEKNRRHIARSYGDGAKQIHYLSMEFLMGRSFKNSLCNLGIYEQARQVLEECNMPVERLFDLEPDAGLGNGGLGRLAACYLDALATLDYPAFGYSILYEYGIFRQKIVDGWQNEELDNWLPGGEVWLQERSDEAVEVRFGGEVDEYWDGSYHHINHRGYDSVLAVPYDLFVSGYDSQAVSRLRLWRSRAKGIDMESFNKGDYAKAMQGNNIAEIISKVLYPNDNHMEGKLLRLKQQYFFCSASINDIVQNHLAQYGTLENLPEKIAVHINDTHPTLAVPELIRVLLDECGYGWDKAVDIARHTFAFTNHTVMPEALETWEVNMFRSSLPRIYQIVAELDRRLRIELEQRYGGDWGKINYMAIIDGGMIRMANLDIYMSHTVNGVSELHSGILTAETFHDYYDFSPEKFTNVTNGIAYRRWLLQSNPGLTDLLGELIGDGFKHDASRLAELMKFENDDSVLSRIGEVKLGNKQRLARYAAEVENAVIDPNSLFDVQAKRVHEYKRQHLNALYIASRYLRIKNGLDDGIVPKTCFFGAKAAPGYYMAKQIIRLICGLGKILENDPAARERLRILYLEDYRVTVAEQLMPAAEISEQISLAGTEASGTSNMKFTLGGAITLGTYDGANIEIREAVGTDNFVLFGMDKEKVIRRREGYSPLAVIEADPELKATLEFLKNSGFSEVVDNLMSSDPYLVLADFASYRDAQQRIDALSQNSREWNRMSLCNIANCGRFSADRAVKEYADNIWNIKPVH